MKAMSHQVQPAVYSRREAAERAKIGLNALDALIRQRAFPVLKLSVRRIVIPAKTFEAFLAGNRTDR